MICIPLFYIHKKRTVHRDLKPENILQKLIGDQEIFSIIDFGTSYNPNPNFELTARDLMTPRYAPIE
jgi:serine/threonine protein kinase